MNRPSVKVRIRCIVDLPVGSWGADVTFDELSEQVKKEGVEKLQRIMRDSHGSVYGNPSLIFIQAVEE